MQKIWQNKCENVQKQRQQAAQSLARPLPLPSLCTNAGCPRGLGGCGPEDSEAVCRCHGRGMLLLLLPACPEVLPLCITGDSGIGSIPSISVDM